MKKDKKFIILLCIIVVIVIILIGIYIAILLNNKTSNNSFDNGKIVSTKFIEVENYNTFFSVNDAINNFYDLMTLNNSNLILDVLDPDFIVENNINDDNIKEFIINNKDDIYFYAKKMYQKGIGNTLYYFISGERHDYENSLIEINHVNLLIAVDVNSNSYFIREIDTNNIYDYAKDYKEVNRTLDDNGNNTFKYLSLSKMDVANYYLDYYKNVLFVNTEYAFNILDEETKNLYTDLEEFSNNMLGLSEILNSKISKYEFKDDKYVISFNSKKIIFIEEKIMDFKVKIK